MRLTKGAKSIATGSTSKSLQDDNNNNNNSNSVTKFRSVLFVGGLILVAYVPLIDIVNGLLVTTATAAGRHVVVTQQETDVNQSIHRHSNLLQQRREEEAEDEFLLDEDGFEKGILSKKSQDHFFQPLRDRIDALDLDDRCRRFQFQKPSQTAYVRNGTKQANVPRRIFYGSLIANEPWEVLDIVATETRDIFTAMVFVESNRTQNFFPRPFARSNNDGHIERLKDMFGVQDLQIRQFINEDETLINLQREQAQRQEILKGWKELGMTGDDVGYIADVDETFSRDFLRAIQYCPYVEALDYDSHHCFNVKAKVVGTTRVFETSPECVTHERSWFHPDLILGRCIEEIGNPNDNIVAPRDGHIRKDGYGRECASDPKRWEQAYGSIPKNENAGVGTNLVHKNFKHPLWSAGDFRAQCGGHMYAHIVDRNNYHKNVSHSEYTAFHLHNFFVDFQATRHKYLTYGHPRPKAMTDRLEVIADDLKLMVRCVLDQFDGTNERGDIPEGVERQNHIRVRGGLNVILPPWPIYFNDATYRRQKHRAIRKAVLKDEQERLKLLNLTEPELELEQLTQELKEAKRKVYHHEKRIEQLIKVHKGIKIPD